MRRGYGKYDYGFRDRVDYEALRRERIPEKTDRFITASLFLNVGAFFAAAVAGPLQFITGTAYSDADTFGTTVIARGALQVAPALFTDADTFNNATLVPGAVAITGTLFSDLPDTFGLGSIGLGSSPTQGLTPALFTDTDTFNNAAVSAGAVAITGTLFSDTDSFNNAALVPGAVAVVGTLFTDSDTFNSASIALGAAPTQSLTPSLFTDSDTFNSATVATAGANWFDASTYDLMSAGADLNNDRYFLPTPGAELVTDPGFDSSPAWSLQSGFTVSGSKLIGSAVAAAGAGAVNTLSTPAVPGRLYAVTFTLETVSAGSVRSVFSGGTAINGTTRTAVGTYTDYFLAQSPNTSITLQAVATFTGQIDTLSVKEVLLDRTGGTSNRGSELLDNGDMAAALQASDYTAGWVAKTPVGTESMVIGSGILTLTADGANIPYVDQSFVTQAGVDYDLVFLKDNTANSAFAAIGATQGSSDIVQVTAASLLNVRRFTATGTTTWIRLSKGSTSAVSVTFDNVSVTKTPVGGKFPKRAATFDEFFAFTASSTTARTYFDNGGVLRDVSYGQNFVANSELLTSWAQINLVPFGTTDIEGAAWRLTDNATNAGHYITSPNYLQSANQTVTVSIEVKPETATVVQVFAPSAVYTTNPYANFDLTGSGSLQSNSGFTNLAITALANGWFRITANLVTAAAPTSFFPLGVALTGNNGALGRVGAYVGTGQTLLVRNPQVKQGATLQPYTKTGSAVGIDKPRFDWRNGKQQLRLEDLRTNSITFSNTFSDTSWQTFTTLGGTVTKVGSASVAPDGGSAFNLTIGASTAAIFGSRPAFFHTFTMTNGTVYTVSMWARASTGTQSVTFGTTNGGGTDAGTDYTLTTAWQRLVFTFTAGGTSGNMALRPGATGAAIDVLIFGAQFEAGPYATDYIPTTTVAVTRAIEGARFSPLIEAMVNRGMFSVVERSQGQTNTSSPNGANAQFIGTPTTGLLRTQFQGAYASQAAAIGTTSLGFPLAAHGGAAGYDASGQAVSYNGSTPVTSTTGYAAVASVWLGRNASGNEASDAQGFYDFVGWSPERVSDAQLQTWAVAA